MFRLTNLILAFQMMALPVAGSAAAQSNPADCGRTLMSPGATLDHVALELLAREKEVELDALFPAKVTIGDRGVEVRGCARGTDGLMVCNELAGPIDLAALNAGASKWATPGQIASYALGFAGAMGLTFIVLNALWGVPVLAAGGIIALFEESLVAGLTTLAGAVALTYAAGASVLGAAFLADRDVAKNQLAHLKLWADSAQSNGKKEFFMAFYSNRDRAAMLEAVRTENPWTRRAQFE